MHMQGPPGTGKTRTRHALIQAVVACDEAISRSRSQHEQVLAVAGTNAAADNLLQGLVGQLRVWSPLLRPVDILMMQMHGRMLACLPATYRVLYPTAPGALLNYSTNLRADQWTDHCV